MPDTNQQWSQIKPDMSDTEAYLESSRCLYCYDAPCIQACPTEIDIPLFIRQINTKNIVGAAKTIYASNYLGNICGKVCPTEVLCEGACVYNHENTKPIEIGRLQSYATQHAQESDKGVFANTKKDLTESRVAMVGAGPASLSCAFELARRGCHVEIFEAKKRSSGLVLHGCAPYKITNEEIQEELDYLQRQANVVIHHSKKIDSLEQVQTLEEAFDAIFIGIGLGHTRELNIPGIDLVNSVGATSFIEKVKMGEIDSLRGKRVVIIGGGNTAMDAASESARLGAAEVYIAYRRSKERMSAYEFEYELAKEAEVKGLFHTTPIQISGSGSVESITLLEENSAKKRQIILPCELVIFATGQYRQRALLEDVFQLDVDDKGRIVTDPKTYATTRPGYFAAGDAVNGGAEVVHACAGGKAAGKAIGHYLQNQKTLPHA